MNRLRVAADAAAAAWSVGRDAEFRAQGSMVTLPELDDPVFGELIAHGPVLDALRGLGLSGTTFTDGYVISKPGRSPRLFWHFDWYGWEDRSAFAEEPVQFSLMYYLVDTSRENGCLRVIPGSHRRRHPIHDAMADGHRALSSADELDLPEFQYWPDEVDVPVRAGDALVVDARLLHAAHANDTDTRRSLITLWYQPHFSELPPRVQATLAAKTQRLPDSWPADVRGRVAALQPIAGHGVAPLARTIDGPK